MRRVAVEQPAVEVELRVEMVVEHGRRHARAPGDLVHACALVAALREHLGRGALDHLAQPRNALGSVLPAIAGRLVGLEHEQVIGRARRCAQAVPANVTARRDRRRATLSATHCARLSRCPYSAAEAGRRAFSIAGNR